jgi:hypothetical protein
VLYKDITKYIHNYFWRVFHSNGWSVKLDKDFSSLDRENRESLYEITLLEEYEVTITAHVITDSYQLNINGEYGVMWLNAEYEYNDEEGYSWSELDEMQAAIIDAEDNLLKIGIPFEKNYEFHGKNRANMKRRNDALIRKLGITEKNKKDWEEYKEAMKKREEKKGEKK